MKKRILVNGACGRMGQEVVKIVVNELDDLLVAACDQVNTGRDIRDILSLDGPEIIIGDNLADMIRESSPDVIIDFTTPRVVMENIETGLTNGINMIVGTTGITEIDLEKIKMLTQKNKVNALIVPNFAVGAILMMKFAQEAAQYLDNVEIIELHHDNKLDAPSGTALKTADLINDTRNTAKTDNADAIEKVSGARGGEYKGIKIHSVRLLGLVAHQEVIFGAEGQSLCIRHDSYNRRSFMPGVKLALEKIDSIDRLVYGLEKILD